MTSNNPSEDPSDKVDSPTPPDFTRAPTQGLLAQLQENGATSGRAPSRLSGIPGRSEGARDESILIVVRVSELTDGRGYAAIRAEIYLTNHRFFVLTKDREISIPLDYLRAVRRLRVTPVRTHQVTVESRFYGKISFYSTGPAADELLDELQSALRKYTNRASWVEFEDRFSRWPWNGDSSKAKDSET
jgi:hypothetical protein